MTRLFVVVAALLGFVAAGCGHNIGDSCHANVDCDPTGLRFCDTSAPLGYCSIDGCDLNTCPSEAVCIRFLTPVLDRPCTFGALPPAMGACDLTERCVCDGLLTDRSGNTSCPSAHCAPESSERRWCQKGCDTDADCRPDYQCRRTGTLGAEPVPNADGGILTPATFCAPMG